MSDASESFARDLASIDRLIGSLEPLTPAPAGGWRVTPLGGLTNRAFLIEGSGAAYVLRLPAQGSALWLDRRAEFHNLRIAVELGLAPPVRHLDETDGVLVSEYLTGSQALGRAEFADPRMQTKIGRAIATLRTSGRAFMGRQDPANAIDRYLSVHADETAVELRRDLDGALSALRERAPVPVPAHVDPHPGNFLLRPDGGLALVDWEFSAMADPFWDAAAVLNFMPSERAVTERLALEALGDAGDVTVARLRVFQSALTLVAGSWAAMEAAARGDQALAAMASDCFENCRRDIEQGRLAESLARMGMSAP